MRRAARSNDVKHTKFWTVAVLLLTLGIARAEEPFDSTFDRLARVGWFGFGPTGIAGVISQGERDYYFIFSRSSAQEDFERLYQVGNLQAKCYALVALRMLSPGKYKQLSQTLRTGKDKVITVSGCFISHEAVADVIKQIDEGKYLLQPLR